VFLTIALVAEKPALPKITVKNPPMVKRMRTRHKEKGKQNLVMEKTGEEVCEIITTTFSLAFHIAPM